MVVNKHIIDLLIWASIGLYFIQKGQEMTTENLNLFSVNPEKESRIKDIKTTAEKLAEDEFCSGIMKELIENVSGQIMDSELFKEKQSDYQLATILAIFISTVSRLIVTTAKILKMNEEQAKTYLQANMYQLIQQVEIGIAANYKDIPVVEEKKIIV